MARLHARWLEGAPGGRCADFSGMELANLDFGGMNFEAASFRQARIHGCDLSARFMFADFRGAEIRDSHAGYCSFEGADFTDAKCKTLSIFRARFDGARMRRARFDGCYFSRAKLECCDMTGVQFSNTELSWVATACSWGEIPPERDADTVLAEGKFVAAMLGNGFGDEGKIAEWMDEAWSRAQDRDSDSDQMPEPREPEYRALLEGYVAAFTQVRELFLDAAETLFLHGEGFAPTELHSAAVCIVEGNSMETLLSLERAGLLLPDNTGALARLKEACDLIVDDAIQAAKGGQVRHGLEEIMTYYDIDDRYELSLHDLLRDREELADARLDHVADMILIEIKPEFLHGITMMMQ